MVILGILGTYGLCGFLGFCGFVDFGGSEYLWILWILGTFKEVLGFCVFWVLRGCVDVARCGYPKDLLLYTSDAAVDLTRGGLLRCSMST